MKDKKLFESSEDLFQKTLHGEADFLKGIMNYDYKSIWSFFLAFIVVLLLPFSAGLIGTFIVVMSTMDFIIQKDFSLIPGLIFLWIFSVLIDAVAIKLFKKLFSVFMSKNKEFKIKVSLLLIIPIVLFVTIVFLVSVSFDLNSHSQQLIKNQENQEKQKNQENQENQENKEQLLVGEEEIVENIKSSENVSVLIKRSREIDGIYESLIIEENGRETELKKERIQGICNHSQEETTQFCGFSDLKFFPSEDYFTYMSWDWEAYNLYFYDLKNKKEIIGPFGPGANTKMTKDGKYIYIYYGAGMWPTQVFYVYSFPEFGLITNLSDEVPMFSACLEENGLITCEDYENQPAFSYDIDKNLLKILSE